MSSSYYPPIFDFLKYSANRIKFLSISIEEGCYTNSWFNVMKVQALTVFEMTSGKLSVTVSK
jgi:hypothetical protein